MSLRTRLLLTIGAALLLLWGAAAAWMLRDLDRNLQRTLDDRLAMSARMVSRLLARSDMVAGAASGQERGSLVVPGAKGMACQIRSLRGEIVASTQGAHRALLQGTTPGYRTVWMDDRQWRTYTLRAGGFDITTADRIDERSMLRQQIAFAAGVPFLIAMLGGLLASSLGIARALAPLRGLQRQLATRRPDSVDPMSADDLPGELRPLMDALNDLLHRIGRAMERERSFTSAAAHELRTPLTAIDTNLQVARLADGLARSHALADAAAGVGRMHATLEQLLMLARLDEDVSFEEGGHISGTETAIRAMAGVAMSVRPRIRCSGAGASLLGVPPALAVVALRNLLDNALKYSPSAEPVELRMDERGHSTFFSVADRGRGMTETALASATQRFWRGQQSAAGSGLGLSLVQAVADRCQGALRLTNRAGGGLVAELELPHLS